VEIGKYPWQNGSILSWKVPTYILSYLLTYSRKYIIICAGCRDQMQICHSADLLYIVIMCLLQISRKLGNRVRSKDVRHRGNLIQCPWMWVMIFTDDRHWNLGPARRFGWVGVLVECMNPSYYWPQGTDPTGDRRPPETTVNWVARVVPRCRYYDVSYSRLFSWPEPETQHVLFGILDRSIIPS